MGELLKTAQQYAPYRISLLTHDELRVLNTLRSVIAIRDTLQDWAFIVASWVAVTVYPLWWVVASAVIVTGTRYYALAIIGHDGLHRRLFTSKSRNDLWNDLFIMGPVCAITRINRTNHMEHHRTTCLPHDPDRYKYVHDHKEDNFSFLLFLSGLQSLWPTARNVFFRKKIGERRTPIQYSPRDLGIILGWQALLVGGLSTAIGWWAYPVLWVLPVYCFAYRADLVRVFCEHSMEMPDDKADEHKRMITYTSNIFERQFFAPHNMNFHIAHHLWPSIPYYNLPQADALIRRSLEANGSDENLVWRRSYTGYILSYWGWSGRKDHFSPAPTL